MSLPRYSAYKATGTELTEIPTHWRLVRARAIGQFSSSGIDKKSVEGEQFVRMFNYLDVYRSVDKVLRYGDGLMATTAAKDKAIEHALRAGDILITPSSETPDDIGHAARVADVPSGVVYSYHLVRYRPSVEVEAPYLVYLLNSEPTRRYFASVCTGTTRQVLVREDMKSTPVCLPSLREQRAIAAFLDRETAKIDALIAEQERLLALLAEKRQATISHAVTRGLDPEVPMKDSGIVWIGEIPSHWGLKRVKHIKAHSANAFVDGPFGSNLKSEHFIVDGDVYVIESNFATQNRIEPSELKTISAEHFETIARSEVRAGDIVIAKIGAQFGKSSILPALDKRCVVSGNSLKLTVNKDVCRTEWAHLQLINLKNSGEVDLLSNGSAQPALSLGGMNNLPFLLPPLEEQAAIIDLLNLMSGKFERLMRDCVESIGKLEERRSALIAGAVTGKIDVRGLAA